MTPETGTVPTPDPVAELAELEAAPENVESGAPGDESDRLLDAVDALAESPEKLEALSSDEVADVISFGFDVVAERRGEHWRLQELERARVAKWLQRVIAKHGMAWVAAWLPEVMAVALLGNAIWSRVLIDREILSGERPQVSVTRATSPSSMGKADES